MPTTSPATRAPYMHERGGIKIVLDHSITDFYLEVPADFRFNDLFSMYRLVLDLGYERVDPREYEPLPDENGATRIELERI